MKCPHCNIEMVWNGEMQITYPPKYIHKCPKCGFFEILDYRDEKELEERFLNEMKEAIPIDILSEEELLKARKIAERGYPHAVKYIRETHSDVSLKEAKCYYDLYLSNKKEGNT